MLDYENALKKKHSVYIQLYLPLKPSVWIKDLYEATQELSRVLKTGGFLVFKWNDRARPLNRVVSLFPKCMRPLFYNKVKHSNRSSTYWVMFRKES